MQIAFWGSPSPFYPLREAQGGARPFWHWKQILRIEEDPSWVCRSWQNSRPSGLFCSPQMGFGFGSDDECLKRVCVQSVHPVLLDQDNYSIRQGVQAERIGRFWPLPKMNLRQLRMEQAPSIQGEPHLRRRL